MSLTWDDLHGLALARQFPTDELAVGDLVAATGPVQSQTARSPFIGLAARSTSVSHATTTEAYEQHALVRGSCIRGTVHTATARQQRLLDVATRVGQRPYWERHLRLRHHPPETLWAALESFATGEWRPPDELRAELLRWMDEAGEDVDGVEPHVGKYLAFGVGLVRRPLRGGWEGQGAPGYRSAAEVTGLPLPDLDAGVDDAVRLHLRCHGPASREDVAWWSGLGLAVVDAALDRLSSELTTRDGPLDRRYHDLPGGPPARDLPGVRLLPEFDAILCGYDSRARDRFVTAEHHRLLWNDANGLLLPPLLVDGRVGGFWRATGSRKKRPLELVLFRGTRRPRRAEVTEAVTRLEQGLGIAITDVQTRRA